MRIVKATERYERWLAGFMPLVEPDLEAKHAAMAADLFTFLRATFYRWLQIWIDDCHELNRAPRVLAVADLHVENFGTWRDAEGRLAWGVNDFDEAYQLAYPADLVRLATSVKLAPGFPAPGLLFKDVCLEILAGYREGLETGGRAFVLGEEHHHLYRIAVGTLRDPAHFWARIDSTPAWSGRVPAPVRATLEASLPEPGLEFRVLHRQAGAGSLGRPRYTAVAEYRGGRIAREAKASAPSAGVWAGLGRGDHSRFTEIIRGARRSPDPFLRLRNGWIVRRLAPDCSRIELAQLPDQRDERRLLHSMGWETANVHLGTRKAGKTVLADLASRDPGWLEEAASRMAARISAEHEEWREFWHRARAAQARPDP